MNEIVRASHEQHLTRLLRENPVVALLGARQVGKTTLAKTLMRGWDGEAIRFRSGRDGTGTLATSLVAGWIPAGLPAGRPSAKHGMAQKFHPHIPRKGFAGVWFQGSLAHHVGLLVDACPLSRPNLERFGDRTSVRGFAYGAELDLLLIRGSRRFGFEFKAN